jgi:hypothetical protein
MKYESPITYYSKDMANVKVFADRQTDGQAKNYMPQIFRYKTKQEECQNLKINKTKQEGELHGNQGQEKFHSSENKAEH